jgi:hypothetical protein
MTRLYEINVSYAKRAVGIASVKCKFCGHADRYTLDPDALAPLPEKPAIPAPAPAVMAVEPKPAKPDEPKLGRNLQYGSEGGGFMGAVYAPAAGNTAAGLAFNDPNPARRNAGY